MNNELRTSLNVKLKRLRAIWLKLRAGKEDDSPAYRDNTVEAFELIGRILEEIVDES